MVPSLTVRSTAVNIRTTFPNIKKSALCYSLSCCIRCGSDEERILDVVPREDGARNSG